MSDELHLRQLAHFVACGTDLAERAKGLARRMDRSSLAAPPPEALRHLEDAAHLAVSGQIIMRILAWLCCAVDEARGVEVPAEMADLLIPDWYGGRDQGVGVAFGSLRRSIDSLYFEILMFATLVGMRQMSASGHRHQMCIAPG